jgi:hypothetical protein
MVTTDYTQLPRARQEVPSLPGRLVGGLAITSIAIIVLAVALASIIHAA